MKFLIVGSGGQGGACASILARQKGVDEIRLVDLTEDVAIEVAQKINSSKVKTVQ
jgi:saccharopine dehydrogenase-like NADP-dependent oxidoreductase